MESKDLWVELRPERPPYLVLRGTYGDKIHQAFRTSRQGVRWRFWRLFNDIYVSSFETILFIEKTFGPQLREHAIRISQERYALRQQLRQEGFQTADALNRRREEPESTANPEPVRLTRDTPSEMTSSATVEDPPQTR